MSAPADAFDRLVATAAEFFAFFERHGSRALEPEPIVPTTDRTILLTNSAVVVFKPFLRGERAIPSEGVHVVQPCARAHNLDKVFTEDFNPAFCLHFTMMGALVRPDQVSTLVDRALEYFESLGFGLEDVLYKVASADIDLITPLRDRVEAVLDTEVEPYYRWTFGDQGLTGRGSTFALRHAVDGRRDVGNLIAFEHEGEVVGFGFGIGVESVLSCVLGVDRTVELSASGAYFLPTSVPMTKLVDLVDLALYVSASGLEPGRRGAGSVVRDTIHSLGELCRSLDVSREEFERALLTVSDAQREQRDSGWEQSLADAVFGRATTATRHLSFLAPATVSAKDLLTRIREWTAGPGQVSDIKSIDSYTGPNIPTGRVSHTISVTAPDDEVTAVSEALISRLADEGFPLRSHGK